MRIMKQHPGNSLLLACAFGVFPIAAAAQVAVYAPVPPPDPVVAGVSPAPTPGYQWIAGYYMWRDHHYIWIPGHWAAVPQPGAVWVPARWEFEPSIQQYVFVAGYWRTPVNAGGVEPVAALPVVAGPQAPAAQPPYPPAADPLREKVQQMQIAAARNEQNLHTYQWVESTTVTVDGTTTPPRQFLCRYAADGTILKTPMASASQGMPMHGGPLAIRMEMKKKQKLQDEVEQIGTLMHLYLPLSQPRLAETLRSGKVDLERDGARGDDIILHNYAKSGDQLKIEVNPTTLQIVRISVTTYRNDPEDRVTADVHLAALADGTLYPALTSVEAPSEKLSITTAESGFSKLLY